MNRAWAMGLAALVLGGCAAGLPPPAIWDDVEALERDADQAAAEQRIRAKGPAGLDALVLAARSLGDKRALKLLNTAEVGIFDFPIDAVVDHDHHQTPAAQALSVAHNWLKERLDLAVALARSDSWFRRSLALMSRIDDPAGLMDVVDALGEERNPRVTAVAVSALREAAKRSEGEWFQRLHDRAAGLEITESWTDQRCREDRAGFAGLVELMRSGKGTRGSLSSREHRLRIHLDRPDGREIAIGPGCALDLYRTLAAEGKHLPKLIEPLLYWGVVNPDQKREAIQLLLADLELIPADKRNLTRARIVNAGGQPPRPVQPVDKVLGFEIAEILEALARQDPEAARSHLERFWLCSEVFSNAKLIALSGFSADPEAADEAYKIGQQCEHGLEPAIIALFRLGDPRAVELLDRRVNKDFPPIPAEVIYALREHRTEELADHLKKRAAAGNEQAEHILATW